MARQPRRSAARVRAPARVVVTKGDRVRPSPAARTRGSGQGRGSRRLRRSPRPSASIEGWPCDVPGPWRRARARGQRGAKPAPPGMFHGRDGVDPAVVTDIKRHRRRQAHTVGGRDQHMERAMVGLAGNPAARRRCAGTRSSPATRARSPAAAAQVGQGHAHRAGRVLNRVPPRLEILTHRLVASCTHAAKREMPADAYAASIAASAPARPEQLRSCSSSALFKNARSGRSGKTATATPADRITAAPREPQP